MRKFAGRIGEKARRGAGQRLPSDKLSDNLQPLAQARNLASPRACPLRRGSERSVFAQLAGRRSRRRYRRDPGHLRSSGTPGPDTTDLSDGTAPPGQFLAGQVQVSSDLQHLGDVETGRGHAGQCVSDRRAYDSE
jgi:hypothetical protein